ncbi:DUF4214 domain-containing protein [Pseudomonas fluorescens]|uniref:DUF4214 domain-containing protein n=1 Tax=Pseudomonas fluorescens TaxID=294 RepID=A0A5E7ATU7_PSEFL|nr:DUF4214 domain-containing protein [Pseudomonas fluorescens]VVN82536.1 hypothetical protein PS723_01204 [Pseudomonas fluorescens]
MAVTIFDFSSGITADNDPNGGPSSNKVTQTIGANTLTLQLDAVSGALAVVMEDTAFFGGDVSNINGNAFETITLPNTAPVFVGAATPVSVSQNAGSTSVASLLHVSDTDSGQTVTWSAISAPQHGTASFIAATAASGSSDISPGGTLSYTPAAGFAGADSFTVQVSDGSATATRVISVNVAPSTPGAPDLASVSDSGRSSADNITNAATLGFSGTSAAGDTNSTVRVFIDTNNNGVYDAGTDASSTATLNNGSWTVNGLSTSGLSDGIYNAYAQVTSATGSLTSSVGAALSVMIDKTAPGQTLSSLALSADTGTSSSDWITKTAAQTVLATLSSPLAADDVLYGSLDGGATWTDITSKVSGATLSWTGVTLAEGSHSLKLKVTDAAGNDGATATQSYILDTTAPVVTSVAVPTDATYRIGDVLDFTINLTEAVTVDTTGGTPQVALTLNTGGTVYANYVSGSGGSALTFRYSVAPGNVDSDGISLGALSANGATIRDLAGNDMALTLNAVGSTSGVLVSAAAPVFASASVNGTSLVIEYTDSLALDALHAPALNDYSVMVAGTANAVAALSIDGSTHKVTLTLTNPVLAGQSVTLAYTDPTAGDDLNALQNTLGNDAASFTATAVSNTTAPVSSGGSSGVIISAPVTGGTLNGTIYSDVLTGLGGKDTFYPNGGSDQIDGGDDIDAVVLNGARDQYSLTHNSDGTFTLQNMLDSSANVAMKNVERLQFNDSLLAINVTSASAQLAELYHLALGRNPDDAGWQYHVGVGVSGASTSQIVRSFVASNEFAAGNGALSDAAFLNQLYGNAFNRAPDSGGGAYWQAQLANMPGAEGRAQVIEGFLASSELAIQITGLIDNGVALLTQS